MQLSGRAFAQHVQSSSIIKKETMIYLKDLSDHENLETSPFPDSIPFLEVLFANNMNLSQEHVVL